AISIGLINERLEITLLDRLVMLADELDLPEPTVANLEQNRSEAQTALQRMHHVLEEQRPRSDS
ncbi:MAG: DUF892 family protein, partial [Halorhabdus sp.]